MHVYKFYTPARENMTFEIAEPDKPCVRSIDNREDCMEAGATFPDAVYVDAGKDGRGLPYGCISDKVLPGRHYIYWNPSGEVKSDKPNIQPICKLTGFGKIAKLTTFSNIFYVNILK